MTLGNYIRPGDNLPGGVISANILSPEWGSMDSLFPCEKEDTLDSRILRLTRGGTMMESVNKNPMGYYSIVFRRMNERWRGHKYPVTKITYFVILDNKGQPGQSWGAASNSTTFHTARGPVYNVQSRHERNLIMRPDGTFLEILKAPNALGSPGARGTSVSFPSIAAWAAFRKLRLGEVVSHG